MDDLVTNLRSLAAKKHDDLSIAAEAANEIERLRQALVPFAGITRSSFYSKDETEYYEVVLAENYSLADFNGQDIEFAKAALNVTKESE